MSAVTLLGPWGYRWAGGLCGGEPTGSGGREVVEGEEAEEEGEAEAREA